MKGFFQAAPTAILLLGFVLWGVYSHSSDALLTVCAIVLHESGHILGARLVHAPFRGFRMLPCEARLTVEGYVLPYGKECFICACGPLFNGLSAWIATVFGATILGGNALSFFATVSLSLALLNLLPISSFDGGRMLFCLLAPTVGLQKASSICLVASFLSLFSLWCISVYALMRTGENLSLFLFSATLFFRIFADQTRG